MGLSSLVPGDIVFIKGGLVAPCDLLLLQGSCIVQEAILTGESTAILKSSQDILQSGTRILSLNVEKDAFPLDFDIGLDNTSDYSTLSDNSTLLDNNSDDFTLLDNNIPAALKCVVIGTGYGTIQGREAVKYLSSSSQVSFFN